MEKWLSEHAEPIIFAVIATWFAGTKWLAGRLHQRHEARMRAIESRQDDHENELAALRDKNVSTIQRVEDKIQRVEDKLDAQYRVIDAKIDAILRHLMTRPNNQREGD